MELKTVEIEKPEDMNFIMGQAHFIKTVEDIHEALVSTVPGIEFGLGFCESSGPRLVRYSGTDDELVELARRNALRIAAGHCFVVFMKDVYPINLIKAIRDVPEVCGIFCATANPVEVVIGETKQGRAVLGVVDGYKTEGVETEEHIRERKDFLRKIGYKF